MKYPDAADPQYEPLYTEDHAEGEGHRRYVADVARYYDHLATVRTVLAGLWELDCDHVEVDLLVAELARVHRTEQQGAMRTIRGLLEAYARSGNDLRNEGSVEFARRALDGAQDIGLPLI